jgi:hypothetical protein
MLLKNPLRTGEGELSVPRAKREYGSNERFSAKTRPQSFFCLSYAASPLANYAYGFDSTTDPYYIAFLNGDPIRAVCPVML